MEFASRQCGLEHVGRIYRALASTGPHDGVQLVDEDHELAFLTGNLLEHRLESLFEFAAKLRTSQHQRDVEHQNLLALERFWYVAVHNALSQPLDDCSLAHARLANEHRVVLGAAGKHLDHAPDLLVPPDDGIELAGSRLLREVVREPLQRAVLAFRCLVRNTVTAPHGLERLKQRFTVDPPGSQQLPCSRASRLHQRQ